MQILNITPPITTAPSDTTILGTFDRADVLILKWVGKFILSENTWRRLDIKTLLHVANKHGAVTISVTEC